MVASPARRVAFRRRGRPGRGGRPGGAPGAEGADLDATTRVATLLPAPVPAVWAVLVDLPAYPRWLSGTSAVDVLARGADGLASRVRLLVAGGPVRGAWVLDYRWSLPAAGAAAGQQVHRVSWSLVSGDALRRLEGHHELRADPGGGTRVASALAVELRVPVLAALRRRAERYLLERQVADLGERVAAC